jgi:hypothetical protein
MSCSPISDLPPGGHEPQFKVFLADNWQQEYDLDNKTFNTSSDMGFDPSKIVGFWVPPHVNVTFYSGQNLTGASATYYGNTCMQNMYNAPNKGVGAGHIQSFQLVPDPPGITWDTFKLSCCMVNNPDITPDLCGAYWGDSTNQLGYCDPIMEIYCQTNPSADACSCLNSVLPQDHLALAVCFDPNCINKGGFKNATQRAQTLLPCGDTTVCNQVVNIGANVSNTLVQAQMFQICPGAQVGTADALGSDGNQRQQGIQGHIDYSSGDIGLIPFTDAQRQFLADLLGRYYEFYAILFICFVCVMCISFFTGTTKVIVKTKEDSKKVEKTLDEAKQKALDTVAFTTGIPLEAAAPVVPPAPFATAYPPAYPSVYPPAYPPPA